MRVTSMPMFSGEHRGFRGSGLVACHGGRRPAGLVLPLPGLESGRGKATGNRHRREAGCLFDHRGKGSTYFGISALASLVKTLLRDDQTIRTVCTPAAEVVGVRDVTISLPRIVNASGLVDTLPIPLSPEETELLRLSALAIRQAIESLESSSSERR